MPKSLSARMFIALIITSGLLLLGYAVVSTHNIPTIRFLTFLLAASVAARLKVKLPGVTGTMSVNLPFILVAVAEMNATEALAVGFISTLVQCLPKGKKFNLMQTAFNCCMITLAVGVARLIFTSAPVAAAISVPSLRLAVAAMGYTLVNTVPMAIVLGLTEAVNAFKTWLEMLQLSFPYLVASAGIAGLTLTLTQVIAWQVPLVVLPIMLGIFQSYRRYFATGMVNQVAAMQSSVAGRATAAVNV